MIRLAQAQEAVLLREIVRAAYHRYVAPIGMEPAPMTDDYGTRIARHQAWVLEDAGAVVGVLVLEERPECFLLDNVAVRPSRQGSGYGRALLDFAEAEARGRGWAKITLYANALMLENIAIYQARGYVETDRRREKGFDRVYMEKQLA